MSTFAREVFVVPAKSLFRIGRLQFSFGENGILAFGISILVALSSFHSAAIIIWVKKIEGISLDVIRNLGQTRLGLLVLEHSSGSWLASAEDS